MRRLIIALAATLLLAPSAQAKTWNADEQEQVAAAGLLPRLADGRFHGERNLTQAQLSAALGENATTSSAAISVTAFDARLVDHLGLTDVAQHVQQAATQLDPPSYFGTEVVARFLGLRTNHPAVDDALELYPSDPITRAEAAHSFAVMGDGQWAREQLMAFELPTYDAKTRRAFEVAASKIGMPYIWGGETDTRSSYWGYQAHGGYDCSGFVWRVFKLTNLVGGIRGRTAAQMAGEIPKSQRIRLDDLQAGDLIFFGDARFHGRATEANTVHVGIALSPHWMIHSSAQGVYISSLDDQWRRDRFTWARRIL